MVICYSRNRKLSLNIDFPFLFFSWKRDAQIKVATHPTHHVHHFQPKHFHVQHCLHSTITSNIKGSSIISDTPLTPSSPIIISPYDHLTCFLRNLYAGQEATVRTGHGTTDWFQIGKGGAVHCHPVYLTYMQSTS